MLSKALFTVATLMLVYDASGHLIGALMLLADRWAWPEPARFWNEHAEWIFPRIEDRETYHWRWAAWHFTTAALFWLSWIRR